LHLADASKLSWKPGTGKKLRICSVGRIVPFKTYNYDAMEIIQSLLAEQIEVEWDIFGDGPDRPALEAKAKATQVNLRFRGEVAYDQLQATMLEYDVFVGMGTAALEAAQTGMPTIVALSDVPRGTYGFLDEAPSDSVAELVEGYPPGDLLADLRRFAGLTMPERLALGRRCAQSAEERSGGERAPFDKMFEAARPCPAPLPIRVRAEILLALQGRHD
jgi:1,2-diacylglycerol 3-alpha-glucosyltransferase